MKIGSWMNIVVLFVGTSLKQSRKLQSRQSIQMRRKEAKRAGSTAVVVLIVAFSAAHLVPAGALVFGDSGGAAASARLFPTFRGHPGFAVKEGKRRVRKRRNDG
jgi:hypothetical protein